MFCPLPYLSSCLWCRQNGVFRNDNVVMSCPGLKLFGGSSVLGRMSSSSSAWHMQPSSLALSCPFDFISLVFPLSVFMLQLSLNNRSSPLQIMLCYLKFLCCAQFVLSACYALLIWWSVHHLQMYLKIFLQSKLVK